ncbi:hypothetical protein N7517_006354 [Penicillium concentricum]|uniref:Uncharacterized protein n=1 Tax=Penicillium concentricum TaxID=293559 RepID=A0A9W9V9X5_9EURO|nr:uncharacterized protein N7517_006354 [Penicillium concentricum]KAJ5374348.1 hypothetical protein N7517_006354 [Penicillium concentricum]
MPEETSDSEASPQLSAMSELTSDFEVLPQRSAMPDKTRRSKILPQHSTIPEQNGHSESSLQRPPIPEGNRWCYTCNKEKPTDSFRAPKASGKEFYKPCEACRTKFRNEQTKNTQRSRAKRAKRDGGRVRPYYLPEPPPQANTHLSDSQTGNISENTKAGPTTAMPEQLNHVHANSGHRSCVTIAPPVVETSPQSTTTTTVITFSTTIVSTNVIETPSKPAENAKSAQDYPQEVKEEDLESLSSGPGSELKSEISGSSNQRPEFFGCLHCEKLLPWPLAALHICLLCIREWKWCVKGAHNQAKVNFLWDDIEHDECYVCYFAGI